MSTPLRVLIVEDRPSDAELMVHELQRDGFSLDWRRADTEADYLARLDPPPDLILADYNLPQFDAPRALAIMQGRGLDIPFIIVTGSISEEVAVESIRRGASDYLLKDRLTRLGPAVTQALEQKKLRDERKRSEARVRHLNDVLHAIRHINQLIVRERDADRLLAGACASLVRTRGYRLAWVGKVEAGEKRVLPVARAGEGLDFLDSILVTCDETETGRGPTGTALRTRQPVAVQDLASDPRFSPWKDAASARGYASAASVPLVRGERLFGALTVYSDQLQAFDDEEIGLLVELAEDIGLALRSIEDEKERKRAESQIRLQATALEAAANAIVITDREGHIIWVNAAFSRLTGYTVEEALGNTPRLLKSGEHSPSFYQILWETILAGKVWHAELVNRRKDGRLYTEDMTITPVPDTSGAITHFIAIKEDVTERKQSEEALATRTLQLEAIRGVSVDMTRELNLATLLGLIFRRVGELIGTGASTVWFWDEAAQVLVPQIWNSDESWRGEVRLRLGEGVGGWIAKRREGLIVNDYRTSSYAIPRFLDRTSVTAVMGEPLLYRDRLLGAITVDNADIRRPFTEEDREILSLLVTHAAIAIENARIFALVDRAAREARSLYDVAHSLTTSLNPMEILHLIAEKTTELLGTPHAQVTLWDEEGQVLRLGAAYGTEAHQVSQQAFRLGEGVNGIVAQTRTPLIVNDYQAFPHRVEGLTHVVADIAVPLVYLGRFLGVLNSHTTQAGATFTQEHLRLLLSFADHAAIALEHASLYEQVKIHADELEQRIAERTRDLETANQQLEAASRHKSAFLANMSHELRTPLNSVLGFAQILLEQTPDLLSTKHTRFLTHIYTSGQHLLQLINDILDLSKVEAGKFVLQPEALPAAATVEDILVIARGLANKKGQRIEAALAPDLPPLHADPVRFKQILFNLLSNAVKFTPAGGTITVRAQSVPAIADLRLQIADCPDKSQIANRQSEMLEIAVTDTGIGIQEADLPRLFQEFVQLESSATKQHEGTGLGLALTRRLVELHGGRIWAASEGEGRGSTFTVVLPFGGPPRASEPSPAIQVS